MDNSLSPKSCPGTDLMSKAIIQDPTVINYITTTLANTQDDYYVGNCEWSDGTRSDVVLEPKSSVLNLPPIIVEIQYTVNQLFMKRAVNYCLQAFKRYKVDPIILIVCVNTLHSYVIQRTMASRFPGGYAFPSEPWAADCIILSKESLGEGDIDTPLNSLVALGLSFTSRALSIVDAPFADDPKMQYLYTLASSHEEDQHNNVLLPLLESQDREYERLLSLANTVGSPDVLIKAINDAKSRNDTLKRKVDSDPVGSLSNKRTATAASSSASSSINNKDDQYKQGMDFVEQFKQARIQKGHKKMDWITCLEEGTKLGLLKYKNANALRNQFSKFTKQKSKNQ